MKIGTRVKVSNSSGKGGSIKRPAGKGSKPSRGPSVPPSTSSGPSRTNRSGKGGRPTQTGKGGRPSRQNISLDLTGGASGVRGALNKLRQTIFG